jgi:hypothetical protein
MMAVRRRQDAADTMRQSQPPTGPSNLTKLWNYHA